MLMLWLLLCGRGWHVQKVLTQCQNRRENTPTYTRTLQARFPLGINRSLCFGMTGLLQLADHPAAVRKRRVHRRRGHHDRVFPVGRAEEDPRRRGLHFRANGIKIKWSYIPDEQASACGSSGMFFRSVELHRGRYMSVRDRRGFAVERARAKVEYLLGDTPSGAFDAAGYVGVGSIV